MSADIDESGNVRKPLRRAKQGLLFSSAPSVSRGLEPENDGAAFGGGENREPVAPEPERAGQAPVDGVELVLPLLYPAQLRAMLEQVLERRLSGLEQRLLERLEQAPHQAKLRPMLDERQLSELIGCDPRTVRRLERSSDIPAAVRIGGSKRWRVEDIEVWLERLDRPSKRGGAA